MKTCLYSSKYIAIVFCVALLASLPVAAAEVVGQTATSGTRVDGIQVPSGTTLLSPALVETGTTPAVIHLSDGRVLAFDQEAAAVVESTERGTVEVTVQSGRIAYGDDSGEVVVLAANNLAALDQEGQIGEGARVGDDDDEEKLCQLLDSTPQLFQLCVYDDPSDDACRWKHIKVKESEVPNYLDIDSLLACEDRNILDLDCDCKTVAAAIWWTTNGTIVGAAVAGTVMGALIINGGDDETRPASPITP
ncbi:MAG: hypothetical protein WBG00_18840 [Thermoanaerobaculia bacterium]